MSQTEIKKKLMSSRKDLLDIGLRNNMINFRRNTKSLMIVDEQSEETLRIIYQQGKTMTFLPMPKKHLKQLASSQIAEDQTTETHDESTLELLHELEGVDWGALMGADGEEGTARRHTDTKLQTALTEERLFLNLLKIHTEAETYIQEQGVNVLFLALGFLHWYEADATDKLRNAPLLLVPVELKRGGAKESFQLGYTGDDLIPNLSLAAKLKTDFALNLPQYVTDSSAEADDMPSLTGFFAAVSDCVSKQKRWKVAPDEIHLGFFSFGKFLMFNDLDPSVWPEDKQPSKHPVLGRLLGDGFVDETPAVAENVHLDSVIAPGEVRFVRDADSSQTLAILEARAGRNLVIQGPPGTGKSQTITNIIAEFLGCGKTVLFVAEKMAALEVVKRRLDENHLGDAVLELHSHKATKQSVLKELARTLDHGRPLAKDGSDEIGALKSARDELNAYCEAVNAPIGASNTPFVEALGHYLQLKREHSDLPVWSFEPMKNWSQKDQVRLREKVSELAMHLQEMGQPSHNPFWGSRRNTFSPVEHNQATEVLKQAISMLQSISSYADQLAAHFGLGRPSTLSEVDTICHTAQRAAEAPHLKGIRLSVIEWQSQRDAIRELLEDGKLMTEALANINSKLTENPRGQDLPVERQHRGMCLSINEWQSRRDAIRELLEADKLMAEARANINTMLIKHAKEQSLLTELQHHGARLSTNEWRSRRDAIKELLEADKLMTEAQANISPILIEHAWEQDLLIDHQHLANYGDKWWRFLSGKFRQSKAKLQGLCKSPLPKDNAACLSMIDGILEYQLRKQTCNQYAALGESLYGAQWNKYRSDWETLWQLSERVIALYDDLDEPSLPSGILDFLSSHHDVNKCLFMMDGILAYQGRKRIYDQYAALGKSLYGVQWNESNSDWEALGQLGERVIALYDDLEESSLPSGILDFLSSHPDVSNCLSMIDDILECQQRKQTCDKHASLGKMLYGTQWSDHRSDWNALGHLSEWAMALYDDLEKSLLPSGILDFLSAHPDASCLIQDIARTSESVKALHLQMETLVERLQCENRFPANLLLVLPLNELNDRLQLWLKELPKLYQLARFNQLHDEMVELGLNEVVDKAAHWQHKSTDLVSAFDLTWYSGLVERGYATSPPLFKFDHVKQAHLLDRFRQLDQSSLGHAQAELAKSIWDRMPNINQPGEMAVIRNELNKKRRLMPIRQIIERAGRAIQHIKPVFMMSPMSIASFLPPGKLEFDVVIFDEASQVKAVDAFGAMLRGRQVIVVGDTRQMPPTDFFSREIETDEEDNTTSDIESVLSMFRARGAQERYLSWHYRSRHESLIAVSNVEFYDRRLVIFPSPGTNKHATGLKFRHLPEAIYDRGRTRTNRLEAKAVAQAVMEHAENNPMLSLGVVAFSMAQRDLIQIEVELLRRENPAVDAYFNGAHPTEPFFVKNLENVQGDERDVIFISIGYGRNESGRIAREFGPINREGGERRLNVLISRAKMGMEVFCNFRADELELDPYASHGIRALKHFLKYAETRELDTPKKTGKQADSPFELEVVRALQERGYQIEMRVGTAGYFIDIAVKNQEFPEQYLLAIECDGASYHSSRSARDRDRLRQSVLESLGWRFHRIWSTDWFRDSHQELMRTIAAIEAAKQAIKLDKPVEATIKPVKEPDIKRKAVDEDASVTDKMAYCKAPLCRPKSATQALHEIPADYLSELIKAIVDIEAPVHETEVTKRLMESFGVSRAGSRISENVGVAIKHGHRNKLFHYAGGFVYTDWSCAAKARNRSGFEPSERKIELIAKEELDAAILDVVRMGFSISQDAAVSGALELLGFGRASANIVSTMNARIKSLLMFSHLKLHEDKLVAVDAGDTP